MNVVSLDIRLRAAIVDDAPAIADLGRQLGYPVTPETMADRLRQLPETEMLVVADVARRVVGWMQLGNSLAIESEPFIEIRGLVVDAACRAQGIGTAFIEFAKQWAFANGKRSLRVRSNTVRQATHRFYEARGFSLAKEQKVFALPLISSSNSS